MLDKTFDVTKVRRDFPILSSRVEGNPLVYLDNAATTQKPRVVLDKLNQFYKLSNANVHRGSHHLSNLATHQFEQARETVAEFINAPNSHEIIWCKGTTEAINLVANSVHKWLGDQFGYAPYTVLVSIGEHHANIVPWQLLAETAKVQLIAIPLTASLEIDPVAYTALLQQHKPKVVALGHVSNATGCIHPVKEMLAQAKQMGAVTLIDGAQAIGHFRVDVQTLNCDFYCFSAHKCFGPTGIGALWGKTQLLNEMPPWQGGGEMIEKVSFSGTSYNKLPFKFEAGTPAIADVIGFAAAIDYLNAMDREKAQAHERQLFDQLIQACEQIPRLRLLSPIRHNVGIVSFIIEDLHHQDIATLLDQYGIAVRSGHHCAMPLMEHLAVSGTLRVSLSFYNTEQELAHFISALTEIIETLSATTAALTVANNISRAQIYPYGHEVIRQFEQARNSQERFNYLIQLSELLIKPSKEYLKDQYLLKQCEAKVWLIKDSANQPLKYHAWSDARIMRGLLVMLISCQKIAVNDLEAFLVRVKLERYLSPSRTNGVKAILAVLSMSDH